MSPNHPAISRIMIDVATLAAVVFILAWPLSKILRHYNLIDRPTTRSSHSHATIRGGGILVIASSLVYLVTVTWPNTPIAFLAACTAVATISFRDDIRSLSARIRLSVHVLASITWVTAVLSLHHVTPFARPQIIYAGLGVICLTGYTNAFNFMDGINGLALSQAIVTGFGSALMAMTAGAEVDSWPVATSLGIAAASLGFLPYNFPRARMFLGDVGSASMGFCLASVAFGIGLQFGLRVGILIVLLHMNFILDTGLTLIRRIKAKVDFFAPHRDHFYQRLNRAGWTHTQVTTTETIIQIIVLIIAYLGLRFPFIPLSLMIILVSGFWLSFFLMTENALNRSKRASQPIQ